MVYAKRRPKLQVQHHAVPRPHSEPWEFEYEIAQYCSYEKPANDIVVV